MTSTEGGRTLTIAAWTVTWFLVLVVVVFIVIRVSSDLSNLSEGTVPAEGEFDRRYVENPVIAYLHIVPGAVYLLGAPFQLSRRFRDANLFRHRSIGLVLLVAGGITGIMALVVGVVMPFGGLAETSASLVFGVYFLSALWLGYRAIRSGRERDHRRWMIRAFAVGVAVGMIRIVIGVGEALGIGIEASFGAAFWIAFVLMTALGELWLKIRPNPPSAQIEIAL